MLDSTTVQLMCAILPGFMSRYEQLGYSDSYAISEAFVLARDFLCEQRKISTVGAVDNSEQHTELAICPVRAVDCEFIEPVFNCKWDGPCQHRPGKQQAGR